MSVYPVQGINIFNYGASYYYGSDGETAAFKATLKQYGIEPSGNKEYDTKLLQIAMAAQNQDETETSSTQNKADRPWAELMWQLGLTLNDDPQQDYDDLIYEIDQRISATDDEQARGDLEDLKDYVDELFYQSPSVTSSPIQDAFAGMNMVAAMNKIMIAGLA